MAARNNASWPAKTKGNTPFPAHIQATLQAYGVQLPETTFAGIDAMRTQVNVMKHESGLELDHFISETDYQQAMEALEQFWELVAAQESYRPDVT